MLDKKEISYEKHEHFIEDGRNLIRDFLEEQRAKAKLLEEQEEERKRREEMTKNKKKEKTIETFHINVFSAVEIVSVLSKKEFKKELKNIVFFSSISALRGKSGYAVYSAAKSSLIGLTKSLAVELNPIKVNCFVLGAIITKATENILSDKEEILNSHIPLGLGKANALNDWTSFLLDKNNWKSDLKEIPKNGSKIKVIYEGITVEWIIFNDYYKATKESKIYTLFGLRQAGKSEIETSLCLRELSLFKETEALALFASDKDKDTFVKKARYALTHGEKFMFIPNIDKDWSKEEIRFGFTKIDNSIDLRGTLYIYNTKEGKNIQAGSGKSPTFVLMDECGKAPFRSVYEAVEPSILSDFSEELRCSPIFTLTGGEAEKSKDAENLIKFPNPAKQSLFEYKDKLYGGRFLSGLYRKDCKVPMLMKDYLGTITNTWLDDITIKVSDFAKAQEIITNEIEVASKSPDKKALILKRIFYPITIDDVFLSESENPYPRELVEQQIKLLESNPIGTAVELYRDNSTKEVKHKLSSKLINTQFPNPDWKLFQDAPIVIYDFPKYKDTYGLHFIGCLPPGEKVMTDKGLKNVEEISLIDKLINTEGNQVDIFNLQQYNVTDEAVYEIKIANTLRTTKFTKEHPILVSENKTGYVSINRYKREGLKQRYKKLNFKFKPVFEVKIKDWVKVPNIYIKEVKPDYEQLWNEITCNNCNKLKNPLENKDFWWLIGLWLGDGWTEKDRVAFVFNKKEPYYISKFIEVCKSLFDKDIIVGKDKESCAEYYISSIKLNLFLTKHFGKYADGKKISEWVKYLKPEFKKELLRGYLNSDGYVGISKTKQLLNIGFVSINLELLEAIQDILFSLGIISNMSLLRNEKTHFFGKKLCNTKKCYQLRLGHTDSQILLNSIYDGQDHKINKVKKIDSEKDVRFKNCFFSDSLDYIYFQIKQINKSQYSGKVYNFECDTHTYMCRHISTHNCDTYNDDEVSYSDSLGSIHVYRKEHADLTDDFRGCMVASYTGRPKSAKEFNEIALMLTEFYNGLVLYEHVTPSLLEYYDGKNKTHMLIDTYDLQKTININTKTLNKKGLKPTTANQKFLLNSELGYLTEELEDGYGIRRIYDLYLLRQYLVDRDKNTDAIISNQHAIAALNMFAKMNVKIDDEQEYEYNPIRNAFGFGMKSSSDTKKRNAFGI